MVRLEVTAEVDENARVELQLPPAVTRGSHHFVIEVDPEGVSALNGNGSRSQGLSLADQAPRKPWKPIEPIPGGGLAPGFSMRRSDWYEDDT